MLTRIKNTLMWAIMGSLPVSRFLRFPTPRLTQSQYLLYVAFNSGITGHLILLIRHSAIFSPAQFIELFVNNLAQVSLNCVTYSFFLKHSALSLTLTSLTSVVPAMFPNNAVCYSPLSIDFFFDAAWWLERECTEMVGTAFTAKGDDRNLLLEYANIYKPLVRTFPSFGLFEVIYNSFLRLLELRCLGLQQS